MGEVDDEGGPNGDSASPIRSSTNEGLHGMERKLELIPDALALAKASFLMGLASLVLFGAW